MNKIIKFLLIYFFNLFCSLVIFVSTNTYAKSITNTIMGRCFTNFLYTITQLVLHF